MDSSDVAMTGPDDTPKTSQLIREMDASARPREKALLGGFKNLTNAELLALIFSTGIRGKSVVELSGEILRDNDGHLSKLTSMTVAEICRRYKGIGRAKAITLLAALEIGARSAADAVKMERVIITSPETAYKVMYPHMCHLNHEEFWVLYLNRRGEIIRESKIGQGGTSATVVDIKIVMQNAIESLADAMMVFHNHPSGQLAPSYQDRDLTRKIKQAADIFGIKLLDHIIVTDGDFYSFNANGEM